MRVRSLESRILGARPSESMSPGLALLNGDTAKTIYSNVFRDVQYISCVSDIKLVLRSTDPDNHCLILAQDSSAGALSTFGYYGTSKGWCIDGKSIATK